MSSGSAEEHSSASELLYDQPSVTETKRRRILFDSVQLAPSRVSLTEPAHMELPHSDCGEEVDAAHVPCHETRRAGDTHEDVGMRNGMMCSDALPPASAS